MEMISKDERTVKLQHLWNNQKLFDWGSEGDVDENKNAFVEDEVEEEKNRYVEEEKEDDVREGDGDVGKDSEKENDVREGNVSKNENESGKEQQYDVIFLHIAMLMMMAVKISEIALKIKGMIHYIINLWCTINKYLRQVQAAIRNKVKARNKVHMKEKNTVYQKVRQDATIVNSCSVIDQTEVNIEETSGWNRFRFEGEINEDKLSQYEYETSIEERVSGRKEICKTIFQNNKVMMHDLRWCKLSEVAENGDEKVKEDYENIVYIIPSMYKVCQHTEVRSRFYMFWRFE